MSYKDSLLPGSAVPSGDRKTYGCLMFNSNCSPCAEKASHREAWTRVKSSESTVSAVSERSCPHPGWGNVIYEICIPHGNYAGIQEGEREGRGGGRKVEKRKR